MIIVIENLLGKNVNAIKSEYDKYTTPEEKASYIYSFLQKFNIKSRFCSIIFSAFRREI